jgi:hypothetical protein
MNTFGVEMASIAAPTPPEPDGTSKRGRRAEGTAWERAEPAVE